MSKPGRNDPCPCGSGKKYKQCCQAREHAATLERLEIQKAGEQAALAQRRQRQEQDRAALLAGVNPTAYAESLKLDRASNAVIDLLHAGLLDEAEQAAHKLLEDYPQIIDGHERLAMVHEARGHRREAADHYRQAIEMVDAHPEDYDPEFRAHYLAKIGELDPADSS